MRIEKAQVNLDLPILTEYTNIDDFIHSIVFPRLFIYRGNFDDRILHIDSDMGKEIIENIKLRQKNKKLNELFNGLSKEDIREFLGLNEPVFVEASDMTSAQKNK